MLSCFEQIGFKPSGGRAVSTVSSRVASCVQPCKRLAPTILPEGLGPATHLSVALQTPHPFSRPPELEPHVEHAISSQTGPESLIARRLRCCEVLVKLCAALQDEWDAWLPRIHCDIRPIVGRRMVPFCREISLVTQFIDIPLWADYVCGLPMAGWACHSMALPPKLTAPSATVQSIAAVAPGHNSKIFASVKSTGDLKLDMASWVKSKKEFEVETLKGPFKFADLPAGVRLLPRRPLWECHGGDIDLLIQYFNNANTQP